MKMIITLQTGIQLEAEVDDVSVNHNPDTGAVTNLKWTHGRKGARLLYVNPNHVSSVQVKGVRS